VGGANTVLADEALENVLATDTIPPFRLDPSLLGSKVIILEAAPLFAKAIERIHAGGSLVELMET
jgi:ribose-phosphate pyrophosphokinase